jgi:hypothetical protein
MSDPRIQARDRGLRRLNTLTGWIAAGCLGIAGAVSLALSVSHHQPASTPVTQTAGTGAPDDGAQIGGQEPTGDLPGLQPPVTVPQPGLGGGGGGVTSGGS